jgi:hypothetical protein
MSNYSITDYVSNQIRLRVAVTVHSMETYQFYGCLAEHCNNLQSKAPPQQPINAWVEN